MDAVVTAASAVATLDGAVDEIALLEAELAELRARYQANPKDWELSVKVGRLGNKVASLRKARAPQEPVGYVAHQERHLTGSEFLELVPSHCPKCGQHLGNGGYVARIGNSGWRCRRGSSLIPCGYVGKVDPS